MRSLSHRTSKKRASDAVCALMMMLGLLTAGISSAEGQIVGGQVVDTLSGLSVEGGEVVLLDLQGLEITRTLTDGLGRFVMQASNAGSYRLRVEAPGAKSAEFPRFDVGVEETVTFTLEVAGGGNGTPTGPVAELVAQVCPDGVPPGTPIIVGVVSQRATGQSMEGAEVRLAWSALPAGLGPQAHVTPVEGMAITGENGFYGVCGAPVESRINIYAASGDAVSELVALRFEGGGVYRSHEFSSMDTPFWRQDFELLQPSERTGQIVGTVVDTSGAPVADANVRIVGTPIVDRTSFMGGFQLTGLPPGDFQLVVDRIGYRPTGGDVRLDPGETLELAPDFLEVARLPTELETITVEAEAAPPPRRDLSEFQRRRETTTGSFITRAEFEEMGAVNRTSDVLRRMQGVRIRPGPSLAMEWIITTTRGQSRGGFGTTTDNFCFPIVFVDRQFIGTTGNIGVDREIPVNNIEAIEVYQGTAGLPPEFNRRGATCGVIVFWTR